jgi:hypothetical protein
LGHNTGFETGIIATKLLKVAISSSLSFEKALDNKPNYPFPDELEIMLPIIPCHLVN